MSKRSRAVASHRPFKCHLVRWNSFREHIKASDTHTARKMHPRLGSYLVTPASSWAPAKDFWAEKVADILAVCLAAKVSLCLYATPVPRRSSLFAGPDFRLIHRARPN